MKQTIALNGLALMMTAILAFILARSPGPALAAEPTNNDTRNGNSKVQVTERSVKRPDPRPKPPIPPKGPTDPQLPPIGPGGTGPTTPK
ncbi:MAG: hypothetical protein QM771_10795 [Nitrospira sp.]